MSKDKFHIRFDRHGHIVVEDEELKRRIRCLLEHDSQIVLRMAGGEQSMEAEIPNAKGCFIQELVIGERIVVRNFKCPNEVCDGGWLKVVNAHAFDRLINPPRIRPEDR